MVRINNSREYLRITLFILLITFALGSFYLFPRVAVPLLVSYIIVLIVSPILVRLMKIGFTRTLASIVLLVGLLFGTIYPVVKVVPLITSESKNIQYYIPKVESYLRTEYYKVKKVVKKKTGYDLQDKYMTEWLIVARKAISGFLLSLPNLIASLVEWIFVVPLFVFFMLKDGKDFRKRALSITPNSLFEKFYSLTHKFNKQIGDYILAKFIEASIVGAIILIGLLIIDVRFALIFALVAALTNIIPYLGPVLGTAPALIFAIAEYGMGTKFGAVAILFIIANSIDIAIVFPILVSKIVDLHPVVVVGSVILGSQMLGIVGMIISIPFAAAVKLIFIEVYESVFSPPRA